MEKIKNWFYKPAFTLCCYVIALVLLIYCIYTLKLSYDSIASYVEAGSVSWTGDIVDIISFFIKNSIEYVFYTFAFVFFGKVISIIKPRQRKEIVSEDADEEVILEEIEEELEEA